MNHTSKQLRKQNGVQGATEMITKPKVNYILLESGVEDVQLVAEIKAIVVKAKINSVKEMILNYPLLHQISTELTPK